MSAIDIVSIGEPMVEFNQTRPGEPEYRGMTGSDMGTRTTGTTQPTTTTTKRDGPEGNGSKTR